MIKGRDVNRRSSTSSYPADLLVCFPSRAHLALTPKLISSPSRPSDSTTNRRPLHRRQLSKLSSSGGGGGGVHGSPALWAKQASSKNMGRDEIAEPTSPKVTCAGQIKVRPRKRGGRGKNWRTVMEEIEKIHSNKSKSKFLGFLTCLKNIKFDFRCFGDFRHADVITSDDDEEEEEEESTKKVFSKWFMVLQEEESKSEDVKNIKKCVVDENADAERAVPPPNALLLMRCRSAPVKIEEDQEMSVKKKDLRSLMEEEKMELVLMRYDTDYYRLSSDIAKETWVVGGVQDPLSRCRSWKS